MNPHNGGRPRGDGQRCVPGAQGRARGVTTTVVKKAELTPTQRGHEAGFWFNQRL